MCAAVPDASLADAWSLARASLADACSLARAFTEVYCAVCVANLRCCCGACLMLLLPYSDVLCGRRVVDVC